MESPSTPPRRGFRLRTPPTPLHGPMHDDFVPYSPPRRSSRKTLNTNPYSSTNTLSTSASNIAPMQTPAAKKPTFGLGYAPSDCFSSPPASPVNTAAEMRKYSGVLSTPRRVDNNKLNNGEAANDLLDPSSSVRKPFMLPTPTKTPTTMTPARKHSRATSMQDSARALCFQPEDPNDSMPSRQQSARSSKFRRLDFESTDIVGTSRNGNGTFQIYTESHARVPHLDKSGNNPFYRPRANTVPQDFCPSPPLFREKSTARIQEERAMHKAAARNEGMIYSFRGKKVFQPFTDSEGNDADTESDVRDTLSQRALKRSAGAAAQRPLTRSQIKPRLLFPPDSEPLDPFTDEEAETDIELPVEPSRLFTIAESEPATPAKTKKSGHVMTPASTARAPRKRDASDVSVYDDEAASVNGATTGLPTPARSSKKKQKHVSFPVFEEGASEPVPTSDGFPEAASVPRPQRSMGKKKLNLTPVAEGESEYELVATTSSPTAGTSYSSGSPFDQWPRTKGGLKRDGEPLVGTPSKRTRSAAAASISA